VESHWMSILSFIPQGTILGPILFLISINDLPEILCKFISTISDHQTLQGNFNELQKWLDKWQLKLNVTKCKVMSFVRGNMAEYKYTITSENCRNITIII